MYAPLFFYVALATIKIFSVLGTPLVGVIPNQGACQLLYSKTIILSTVVVSQYIQEDTTINIGGLEINLTNAPTLFITTAIVTTTVNASATPSATNAAEISNEPIPAGSTLSVNFLLAVMPGTTRKSRRQEQNARRQDKGIGFLSSQGQIKQDCSIANTYTLDNGKLSINNSYFSTSSDVPYAPFISSPIIGDISTIFSLQDDALVWNNPAFDDDIVRYCYTDAGELFTVFAGPLPDGCHAGWIEEWATSSCLSLVANASTSASSITGNSSPSEAATPVSLEIGSGISPTTTVLSFTTLISQLSTQGASSPATTSSRSAAPPSSSATIPMVVGHYTYQGCYAGVALSVLPVNAPQAMTVELCASICLGFAYMGISQGNTCQCAHELASDITPDGVGDSHCNSVCTGSSLDYCGGSDDPEFDLQLYFETEENLLLDAESVINAQPSTEMNPAYQSFCSEFLNYTTHVLTETETKTNAQTVKNTFHTTFVVPFTPPVVTITSTLGPSTSTDITYTTITKLLPVKRGLETGGLAVRDIATPSYLTNFDEAVITGICEADVMSVTMTSTLIQVITVTSSPVLQIDVSQTITSTLPPSTAIATLNGGYTTVSVTSQLPCPSAVILDSPGGLSGYYQYYKGAGFTEDPSIETGSLSKTFYNYDTDGCNDAQSALQSCVAYAFQNSAGNYQHFDLHWITTTGGWVCNLYTGQRADASEFSVANAAVPIALGYSYQVGA